MSPEQGTTRPSDRQRGADGASTSLPHASAASHSADDTQMRDIGEPIQGTKHRRSSSPTVHTPAPKKTKGLEFPSADIMDWAAASPIWKSKLPALNIPPSGGPASDSSKASEEPNSSSKAIGPTSGETPKTLAQVVVATEEEDWPPRLAKLLAKIEEQASSKLPKVSEQTREQQHSPGKGEPTSKPSPPQVPVTSPIGEILIPANGRKQKSSEEGKARRESAAPPTAESSTFALVNEVKVSGDGEAPSKLTASHTDEVSSSADEDEAKVSELGEAAPESAAHPTAHIQDSPVEEPELSIEEREVRYSQSLNTEKSKHDKQAIMRRLAEARRQRPKVTKSRYAARQLARMEEKKKIVEPVRHILPGVEGDSSHNPVRSLDKGSQTAKVPWADIDEDEDREPEILLGDASADSQDDQKPAAEDEEAPTANQQRGPMPRWVSTVDEQQNGEPPTDDESQVRYERNALEAARAQKDLFDLNEGGDVAKGKASFTAIRQAIHEVEAGITLVQGGLAKLKDFKHLSAHALHDQ